MRAIELTSTKRNGYSETSQVAIDAVFRDIDSIWAQYCFWVVSGVKSEAVGQEDGWM